MSRMSLLSSTLAMRNTLRRSGKNKSSSNSGSTSHNSYYFTSVAHETKLLEKAISPYTPMEELEKIKESALTDKQYLQRRLIENPIIPVEWFKEMLESNKGIASYIAQSKRCPVDLLLKIANGPYVYGSRSEAIRNPNFPVDKAIEMCKQDPSFVYNALRTISKRNNLTIEDIKKIITFKDEKCDYAIVLNPITPISILKDFMDGKYIENKDFRTFAKQALTKRAGDSKTSESELREISKIKDISLKLLLANNPNCPQDVFKYLMNAPLSIFFNKEARKKKRSIIQTNRKTINKEELNRKIKPIKKEKEEEVQINPIPEETFIENDEEKGLKM